MAAPLSLSLSVSLSVCVSLSISLYLCLSPSPVCLIAEGMWSSCRRLQNSTRHFRELMSLYYCTSSKQAALCNLRVSIRPLARVTHKAYHRRLHENISWRCRRAARVGRGPAAPYAQTPLALRPVGIRRGSQWAVCCTRSLACAGRRDAAPGGSSRAAQAQMSRPGRRCWCRRATRRSVRTGKRQAVRCSVHGQGLHRTLQAVVPWSADPGCSKGESSKSEFARNRF